MKSVNEIQIRYPAGGGAALERDTTVHGCSNQDKGVMLQEWWPWRMPSRFPSTLNASLRNHTLI